MSGRSPSRFPETVTCGTHKWTRKILIHSVIVCWLVFFFFLQRVRTHLEHVGWFQVHPTSVRLLIKKICSGFFLRGVFLPGRLMFGVYLVEGLLLILSPSQFRQPPTGVLRKLVLMRSYFYLFSIFFICSLVNLPKVIILLYYIFSLKKILKNDWYEFIDGVIFNLPIFFIIYFKY